MTYTAINYWAVLVAALAYMILGAIWYSPALFGGAWMRGIGKTKEQVAAGFSPVKFLWALIGSFIAAYGIARIMSWAGGNSPADGLMVGLLAAICFVLTAMTVNDIMENRPRSLTVINVLYHIIGFALMGLIIGVW